MNERMNITYQDEELLRETEQNRRRLLAQLRAGHCLEMSQRVLLPSSTRCNEEEETVAHIGSGALLQSEQERKSNVNVDVTSTNPTETLAFAMETFKIIPQTPSAYHHHHYGKGLTVQ